eukprot:IDg18648t1
MLHYIRMPRTLRCDRTASSANGRSARKGLLESEVLTPAAAAAANAIGTPHHFVELKNQKPRREQPRRGQLRLASPATSARLQVDVHASNESHEAL